MLLLIIFYSFVKFFLHFVVQTVIDIFICMAFHCFKEILEVYILANQFIVMLQMFINIFISYNQPRLFDIWNIVVWNKYVCANFFARIFIFLFFFSYPLSII